MKETALITICIPCYNIEKNSDYKKCFKSLMNNFCDGLSLLFCNDGSSDNTGLILANFQSDNPKIDCQIITNNTNVGIASARNILINNVKTRYFYFIDSDDLLIGNKTLKKMMKIVQSKQAKIYLFKSYMKKYYGKYFSYSIPLLSKFSIRHHTSKFISGTEIAANWNPIFIWNIIFETKYYKSLNAFFLDGYNFDEDCVIFLYVFINTKDVYFVNKTTYKYISRATGLTRNSTPSIYLSIAKNIDYLYELLNINGFEAFIRCGAEKYFWTNFTFIFSKKILKNYNESEEYRKTISLLVKSLLRNGVISRNQKIFKSRQKFWKLINCYLYSQEINK